MPWKLGDKIIKEGRSWSNDGVKHILLTGLSGRMQIRRRQGLHGKTHQHLSITGFTGMQAPLKH